MRGGAGGPGGRGGTTTTGREAPPDAIVDPAAPTMGTPCGLLDGRGGGPLGGGGEGRSGAASDTASSGVSSMSSEVIGIDVIGRARGVAGGSPAAAS